MRARLRAIVVVALLVAACHDAADKPAEPVWGKQPCDHCAMLLDEPRFAAQLATSDGMHLFFDDVGCLAAWLREHPSDRTRGWVRRQSDWVDARAARYTPGQRTPMGYGFVAASDGSVDWTELARRLAARDGEHADAQ